jgi:hypothetical protein
MADLLECLIQIKALEQSIGRIERIVPAIPPGSRAGADALVAGLIEAERACARVGLGRETVNAAGASAPAVDVFIAERRANLAVLQASTAADLGRHIDWPGRPGTTLADLVAIMLANDTDRIGDLQALSRPDPEHGRN